MKCLFFFVKASEIVMSRDRNNVSAILVKAESLYNTCFFEHGLILFHRGKALAPENEEFRLGIQKCHKTIGMDWFCPELFILTLINYLKLLKVLRWIRYWFIECNSRVCISRNIVFISVQVQVHRTFNFLIPQITGMICLKEKNARNV